MKSRRLIKFKYGRKKNLKKKRMPEYIPTDWDFFAKLNFRAAEAIRNELKVDEESFLFVHGQSWEDTRSYIIYTALDEVQKMVFYLVRMKDLIFEVKLNPRSERSQRLQYEEIIEDQQSKVRRLLEILIVLILFEETNETEYYRHFIHIEELDSLLYSNKDLEEFYSARSANINDSINLQVEWINQVESKINIENCWYLREKKQIYKQNLRGSLLSSMRQRIKMGIPLMSSLEKILFGFSYKGIFGRASESLHYTPLKNIILPGEKEFSYHSLLGLLGFSIIKRTSNLLGNPNLPQVNQIIDSLERTIPDDLVFSQTIRNIKVGDYVLAYGDLAEVLEIKSSTYGYRSYKILYLAEKPKPEIHEDWFPAKYIQRIFDGENIRKKVIEKLTKESGVEETALVNIDWKKILRKSVIEIWNIALRDHLKNRSRNK